MFIKIYTARLSKSLSPLSREPRGLFCPCACPCAAGRLKRAQTESCSTWLGEQA